MFDQSRFIDAELLLKRMPLTIEDVLADDWVVEDGLPVNAFETVNNEV